MGLRSASSATHAYLLHFPFFLDKTVGNDSLSYHNGFKFGTFYKHHAAPKCVSKSTMGDVLGFQISMLDRQISLGQT